MFKRFVNCFENLGFIFVELLCAFNLCIECCVFAVQKSLRFTSIRSRPFDAMLSPCMAQLQNSFVFTVFVHTEETQRFDDPFNVFVHALHESETGLLTTESVQYESQRFDVLSMSVSVQCRRLLCLFRHRLSLGQTAAEFIIGEHISFLRCTLRRKA